MGSMGPLRGVRVVDITQMVSGPLCTSILADQGAEVIKVEPPSGDGVRAAAPDGTKFPATFATINRNKKSVVIDLHKPKGVELVARLVRNADVFVQNLRPGAAERLGVGEAALRKINPRLVYVSISGFGESGPYSQRRVYDPIVQAVSGLASIQAAGGERPKMMRLIISDKITGFTAAQAVTAALFERERSGEGQHVKLSMLDATIAFLWAEGMAKHTFPDSNIPQPILYATDLVFATTDGYITAGAVSNKEWAGMCKALRMEHLVDDPRFKTTAARAKNIADRLSLTEEKMKELSTAEAMTRLEAHGVPCGIINHPLGKVLEDEQVRHNGTVIEVQHKHAGRIRLARPAARFGLHPEFAVRYPVPLLGENTKEVLAEICSEDELRELRRDNVAKL